MNGELTINLLGCSENYVIFYNLIFEWSSRVVAIGLTSFGPHLIIIGFPSISSATQLTSKYWTYNIKIAGSTDIYFCLPFIWYPSPLVSKCWKFDISDQI